MRLVRTQTFKAALRSALRQDPDVVLVGDCEIKRRVQLALEVANGSLGLWNLAHMNAISSIDRIVIYFPPISKIKSALLWLKYYEA